jgi:transposase
LPSITATTVSCPQCGQPAHIKLVEPDPVNGKERRTFQCDECGLPRTYTFRLH